MEIGIPSNALRIFAKIKDYVRATGTRQMTDVWSPVRTLSEPGRIQQPTILLGHSNPWNDNMARATKNTFDRGRRTEKQSGMTKDRFPDEKPSAPTEGGQ